MSDWDKVVVGNQTRLSKLNLPPSLGKQKVFIYDKWCPYSIDGIAQIEPVFNPEYPKNYGIHGTSAAQIIQLIAGGAEYVEFYGCAFVEPAQVVDYCIANNIRIISASIDFSYSDEREAAFRKYYDWGGIAIASVGNTEGHPVCYPASSPYVMGVSATNDADCDGPEIDVTEDSYWYVRNESPGMFMSFSGTSCSTPVIVGCVKLMLDYYPNWRMDDVISFIAKNNVPLSEPYERFFSFPERFGEDMTKIEITLDKNYMHVNGQVVPMDVPAVMTNNRIMVPVRFIAEALGAKVTWDQVTKTAIITKE